MASDGAGNGAFTVGVEANAGQLHVVIMEPSSRQVSGSHKTPSAHAWNGSTLPAHAAAELLAAVTNTLAVANVPWSAVAVLCVGTSLGDGGQQNMQLLREELLRVCPLSQGAEVLVHSSIAIWLCSGTGGPLVGCVLMAGMDGSQSFGAMADRRSAVSAGWGAVFADGGSAFDLGSRGLAAISRAHDGRGADTLLVGAIKEQLGAQEAEDLIRWAQNHSSIPERITSVASLAVLVIDCAARGDTVCDAILRHAVGELLRSAKAVSTKLGLDRSRLPFKLVLAGPMLRQGTLYTQYLLEVLKEGLPTADVVYPKCEPAEAAAQLGSWLLNPQQPARRQ